MRNLRRVNLVSIVKLYTIMIVRQLAISTEPLCDNARLITGPVRRGRTPSTVRILVASFRGSYFLGTQANRPLRKGLLVGTPAEKEGARACIVDLSATLTHLKEPGDTAEFRIEEMPADLTRFILNIMVKP